MDLQELGRFKVGDSVVYESGTGIGSTKRIEKVSRITSQWGGTVYVGNQKFDSSGNLRTSNSWSTSSIQPATDELRLEIKASRARDFLRSQKFEDYSDEDAIKAADFIWVELKR